MPQFADRVQETTTTSGTGSVTLGGAVAGCQAFQNAFSTGTNNIPYTLVDGANWEVGLGTLAATTTLTRDVILSSNNSGAAINLSGGSTSVFCDMPAYQAQGSNRGRVAASASGMNMY